MFQLGDMIEGWVYNDQGDEVKIMGAFQFRTNDPEEMIQDIVIRTPEGKTVYIAEQVARPYRPTKEKLNG